MHVHLILHIRQTSVLAQQLITFHAANSERKYDKENNYKVLKKELLIKVITHTLNICSNEKKYNFFEVKDKINKNVNK